MSEKSNYIELIERKYNEYNWIELEKMGFKKNEDYCFIYSYPPVRALDSICEDDLFVESKYGKLRESANLYIHIPYCTGKCTYCYFASVSCNNSNPILKKDYPKYLEFELGRILELSKSNPEIQSIHIGGGTPFLLNYEEIKDIMNFIKKLKLKKNLEITIESSPETINRDYSKLKKIKQLGINRISIGVESLSDKVLELMNRRHNSSATLKAIDKIIKSGFTNINVDLIYGLPEQSLEAWVETILTLEKIGIQSISAYRLRKHPKTDINIYKTSSFPSYETCQKMQLAHGIILKDKEFLSSSSHKYARSKNKIQKQLENKRGLDNNQLVSIGCGAYGYINSTFFWNTRSLSKYKYLIKNKILPVNIGQILSKNEIMRKAIVIGLHTYKGISIENYKTTFDISPLDLFENEFFFLKKSNMVIINKEKIRLTELGRFFTDEISLLFYSKNIKNILRSQQLKYGMFWEKKDEN